MALTWLALPSIAASIVIFSWLIVCLKKHKPASGSKIHTNTVNVIKESSKQNVSFKKMIPIVKNISAPHPPISIAKSEEKHKHNQENMQQTEYKECYPYAEDTMKTAKAISASHSSNAPYETYTEEFPVPKIKHETNTRLENTRKSSDHIDTSKSGQSETHYDSEWIKVLDNLTEEPKSSFELKRKSRLDSMLSDSLKLEEESSAPSSLTPSRKVKLQQNSQTMDLNTNSNISEYS